MVLTVDWVSFAHIVVTNVLKEVQNKHCSNNFSLSFRAKEKSSSISTSIQKTNRCIISQTEFLISLSSMAAAFAVLVSLQNNLDLIYNHPRHSFSFDQNQLASLWQSVIILIEFMESSHNSHGCRNEAAEALEGRITRAAEAAEDVIESHVVDQIRGGKTRGSKTASPRFLLDLHRVTGDMYYICQKARDIIFYARSVAEAEEHPASSAAASTSSSTPLASDMASTTSNSMVGSDDILEKLLDQLTGVPSSRRVIPIVGMGGIGKTTLANHAFRHQLVVERFDICLWATIFQQYNVVKILAHLLRADESTSATVDELGERLYKRLRGQRYLIVLDDMWSVEAWEEIKFFFPDTDNGSRIVVTTRHSYVAKHLGNSWLDMHCLDEDKSWDLFCQKTSGVPLELEEIGKKIVEKCRGLPLAIIVVAGDLRKSSMTLEYWGNVANHMTSVLNSTENEEQCMNILALSYSYLPPRLKPCFLLLGAFPEDETIHVSQVVQLWNAEGFLKSFVGASSEAVARSYIKDLLERNLILADGLDFQYFKLHDLLRELCLKIANKEEFLYVFDTPQLLAINKERRVVINGVGEVNHYHARASNAPIRCLIYERGWVSHDFKLLKTLSKVIEPSMIKSIFQQQVNLRYLKVDLIYNPRKTMYLPSSISLLWNLQILTINVPVAKVIAPYEIWEMLQLRHLDVTAICLLDPLPVDRANDDNLVLRNLLTLRDVENLRLSEEVCKRIPHVRELYLSYRDEADSYYYCPKNLCCFHGLEILDLQFRGSSKWCEFALSLTFPASLLWLTLSGCGVDWEDLTTMVGSLPHLLNLRLYPGSVIGTEWNPVEGDFKSLRCLDIWGCDDLIQWNADSCHFPALRTLRLQHLSKLEELPSGIGGIDSLELIQLEYCSESESISAMTTLVEQEELGNETLRLHVSFQGDEETLESFNDSVPEEVLTNKNLTLRLQPVKP